MKSTRILFLMMSIGIQAIGQNLSENHVTVDGRDRMYLLFTPSSLESSKKYPVVIVLHGGKGNARQVEDFTGFSTLAEKEKFLVLYPNGYKKSWNDGRIAPDVKANAEKVDDVKFIKTALDEISLTSPVDSKKVFVTGISNGAMMSIYLAYHLSDRIRAIAPVAGSIPENISEGYHPANAVSILVINGTSDNLVPFAGGRVAGKRTDRGSVISTQQTIDIWRRFTNETGNPKIYAIPDTDKSDRCNAERFTYPSSTSVAVELIRVNNGGHTWPGGKQYLPRMIVGNVCRDFNAEEVIWSFFKNQQPR